MGKYPFLRRNWKLIVNIITVAVLVLLVFLIRDQIVETFKNLGKVDWHYLLLIIPLVAVSYHAQVRMYQRMFWLIGHKLHYGFMFKVALELNFVNQVFPSGGVSGISYFGVRMRSADITATQASLVQIMKLLLLFVSFELLLIVGLLILALDGKANDLMLLVAGSITTLLVIGTVGFVAIIGSERRIHVAFTAITRLINRLIGFFTRNKGEMISTQRAEGIVKDLHVSYKTIESRWFELRLPLWWALWVNLSAIVAIYVVYLAFGEWVNLGAIIVAYSVANFAGLISVLPGGAGIYEALMVGVLVAGGIPAALSLPVTVMWRVLTTIIQLLPGYWLYHRNVRRTGNSPLDQPHEH